MARNHTRALELRARAEGRRITTEVVDGHRDRLPVDPSTVSRWCTGDYMSPIGYVILKVALLPEPCAGLILSAVEDAYSEYHGGSVDLPLSEALVQAAGSDSRQDVSRAVAARVKDATDDDLHQLISDTYAQQHDGVIVRRSARAELARRNGYRVPSMSPMRPSQRRQEARAS